MQINRVGLDLAKQSIQVHAAESLAAFTRNAWPASAEYAGQTNVWKP